MSNDGLWLIFLCSLSAAISSLLMRMGIDNAGGFAFNMNSILQLAYQPIFLVGVILYGIAGIGWFRIVATEPLSVAYPILVSLTFAIVSIGAMFLFKEHLTLFKLVGLGLIILGIYILSRC